MINKPLKDILDEIADGTPAPGAGSAAAVAGAMGAAIVSMVCRVTLGSDRYADAWDAMREPIENSEKLRHELAALAEEDIAAYRAFADALKLPRETAEEKEARKAAIQIELRRSTEVPLAIARRCREALEVAFPVAAKGAPMAVADIGTAAHLLEAGRAGALCSVRANLALIKDTDYIRQVEERMAAIDSGLENVRRRLFLLVESRM